MESNDNLVLLIESDFNAATFIRGSLADAREGPFAVEWVANLGVAIERLNSKGIKAILLNLYLSDSQGIETFDKLHMTDNQIPILILSDLDHEEEAKRAIQNGAKDYLLTGHINSYSLSRVTCPH